MIVPLGKEASRSDQLEMQLILRKKAMLVSLLKKN